MLKSEVAAEMDNTGWNEAVQRGKWECAAPISFLTEQGPGRLQRLRLILWKAFLVAHPCLAVPQFRLHTWHSEREREREGGQTLQPATLREGGDGWGMQTESESGTETHNRRQLQKRDKVGRRLWQGNKHLECPKKSNSASLFLFSVCRQPLQTEVTC